MKFYFCYSKILFLLFFVFVVLLSSCTVETRQKNTKSTNKQNKITREEICDFIHLEWQENRARYIEDDPKKLQEAQNKQKEVLNKYNISREEMDKLIINTSCTE